MNGSGLVLFRQGLGLLCVLDACLRLPDSSFWLSDLGVLPRSLYFRMFEDSLCWSIYSVSGRPGYALTLLLVTIGLGLVPVFRRGASPRWVRVFLWILVLSVQHRNPGVVDSSDELLRLMLFWDILLPDKPVPQRELVGPAVWGLKFQQTLALGLLNWSISASSWKLQVAFSQNPNADFVPQLWLFVKLALGLLLVAVWVRRARIPALAFSLPVLLAWGICLHPVLPLTIGVVSLTLYPEPGSEEEVLQGRWIARVTVAAGLIVLGQFIPGVRIVAAPLAQLSGLEQSWNRSYPLAAPETVELIGAASPNSRETIWMLDASAGRRARIWASEVSGEKVWASRLVDALNHRFHPEGAVAVWIKTTNLDANGATGEPDIQFLTGEPPAGARP